MLPLLTMTSSSYYVLTVFCKCYHVGGSTFQYHSNITGSSSFPTLLAAAAVTELAAERVSSPRHAASTLPSISPLVGSWVNQRHQICSLDYGKEFKHDGNLFSNWLMSKNHCNVLMLLNDITIQMTRGMNASNREANAVGKEYF